MKTKLRKDKLWDVIVIGGGPAGMMAAGRAAELGKSTLLLEKNDVLGKKLLITGGGRCNVTNYKPELRDFVSSYRNSPKALYSMFSQYSVDDTISFFHSHGMDTKIEAEDRVFPVSDKAESVWQVMLDYMKQHKVRIHTDRTVQSVFKNDEGNLFTIVTNKGTYFCKSCIVATGGTSRPETGSTGEGFKWLEGMGHTIINSSYSLVPITVNETWVKEVSGQSLQDVRVSIYQDNKKQASKIGKVLFTHVGLSGPTILNMSSTVGEFLKLGKVFIEIDMFPDIDHGELKRIFYKILSDEPNKMIKNTITKLVRSTLANVILGNIGIDINKYNNSITKEERISILKQLKGLRFSAKSLLGAEKAIVSSGGVKIEEINFKTMESKIVPKLYIIGDVLHIDRPSGGYSLQICWSSGYIAGCSS